MIRNIINRFYNLAREHRLIMSFRYGSVSKSAGIGDELHPHFLLEDPILINNSTVKSGVVTANINFNIVLTPQSLENFNVEQPTIEYCQSLAYSIALNFVAKMRDDYSEYISDNIILEDYFGIEVVDYDFMTLRDWYDNAAAGVRCSMTIQFKNPIQLCDVNAHFDPEKQFNIEDLLPQIDLDDPSGCEVFEYKLPTFDL